MAKSKKDNTGDTPAAEDSLPGSDSMELGDPDSDTVRPDGGPEDTPETADSDDTTSSAEDTVDFETADPASDTRFGSADAVGSEDVTHEGDRDTSNSGKDEPETSEPKTGEAADAGEEDSVPHEGGDVAAAETDDTLPSETSLESAYSDDTLDAAAAAPASAPSTEPKVIRETVVERKGGLVPMVLGGVVAAALGYAAGAYPDLPFLGAQTVEEDPFVTETRAALRSQGEQIDSLAARADANAEALLGIDMGEVNSALSALESDVSGLRDSVTGIEDSIGALGDRLTALDGRMTEVEKQPLKDAVSPETIAAYEREIETLRDEVAAQQAAMEAARQEQQAAMEAARQEQQAAIEAAREEIEAIAERARAAEASAEERARLAASRSALAELTTRARDGQPYADSLSVLTGNGVDVPAPLTEGADEGLPTVSALISSFPDAARDALATARASTAVGDADGGLSGFLQSQLGARSVTPREGDDPDAILSRAEAALRAGDLDTTLSEISALPDAAQEELSDWVAQARLRRDALAASAELTRQLNQE